MAAGELRLSTVTSVWSCSSEEEGRGEAAPGFGVNGVRASSHRGAGRAAPTAPNLPSPVVLRSPTSDRRWKGCWVSSCDRGRGEKLGKEEGGGGDDGHFKPGTRRWGMAGGVAPCGRRGLRERGRECVCGGGWAPTRLADGARPAASRGRLARVVWRGHAARPAEQGRGLTGGPRPHYRAAAPGDK
jgi:hypothetical protein